jgi:hypothetical protein
MLAVLMRDRTAWGDYFTGNPTKIQPKVYGGQQTPSDTSVYVLNCLFISITSTSNGGALSCTAVTYLLIETSTFFLCKTSGSYGGAIYFSNSGGQCVLHEVCGNDCCVTISSSWGQFISMNKCYYRSAIQCTPFGDSNSVTCSFSYSSFTDNNATYYMCIYLDNSAANYEIKSCNILRNTQVSLSSGIIRSNGNLIIEDSCILENQANYIFYQGSSSYTITLSNCTVDNTAFYGSYKITNTVTKSFILALDHMSTLNCHAGYDSAGTLIPIVQYSSSSKNQKLCYTCERLLCQLTPQIFLFFISFYFSL